MGCCKREKFIADVTIDREMWAGYNRREEQ